MKKMHQKELQWYGRNIPDDTPMTVNNAITIVKSIEKFKNISSEIDWDELISQTTTSDSLKCGLFGSALYNELYYNSAPYSVKEALNSIGIWGPCWKNLTKYLATKIIGNKRVLEVGSGLGILSLGLSYYGADVIPVDSFSDNYVNPEYLMNSNTIIMDGIEAIDFYKDKIDMVMISWAPLQTNLLTDIFYRCKKYNLPLLFIGELDYGCNGSEEFWDRISNMKNPYEELGDELFIKFLGIHDTVAIFNKRRK